MTSRPSRPIFLRSLSSTSSIRPAKDKPRLYIALFPRSSSFLTRPHCDSYHWSIIVSGQTPYRADPGTRYHVAHDDGVAFFYEEQDIPTTPIAQAVYVRVAVAKVRDEERLRNILRDIQIDAADESFTCYTWVREAFYRLLEDGRCVKSYLGVDDWESVERCARKYCNQKRDEGRFQTEMVPGARRWDSTKVSTFNYWENREVVV